MSGNKMMKLEFLTRGLPENVKHYLHHIGVVTCEQDYQNKIVVLKKICPKNSKACLACSIVALDFIRGYNGK